MVKRKGRCFWWGRGWYPNANYHLEFIDVLITFPIDFTRIEPGRDKWISISIKLINLSFSEDIIYAVFELVIFWNTFLFPKHYFIWIFTFPLLEEAGKPRPDLISLKVFFRCAIENTSLLAITWTIIICTKFCQVPVSFSFMAFFWLLLSLLNSVFSTHCYKMLCNKLCDILHLLLVLI